MSPPNASPSHGYPEGPPPARPKTTTPTADALKRRRRGFTLDRSRHDDEQQQHQPAASAAVATATATATSNGRVREGGKQRRRRTSLRKNVFLRPCRDEASSGSSSGNRNGTATSPAAAPATVYETDERGYVGVASSIVGGEHAGVSVGVGVGELYPVMVMGSGGGRTEMDNAADTVYYGWVVLIATWLVVVIGMGSVFGVWEWAWNVGKRAPWDDGQTSAVDFPIPGYYPALIILCCVMAWVWVTVAWVGMKYFKHAKIQG